MAYTDISLFNTNQITATGGSTGGGDGTICLIDKNGPIRITASAPADGEHLQQVSAIVVRFLFGIDESSLRPVM